jgi:hypothetical protein
LEKIVIFTLPSSIKWNITQPQKGNADIDITDKPTGHYAK